MTEPYVCPGCADPKSGSAAEALAAVMERAPDPSGWRAGLDHDDYLELAEAVLRSGLVVPVGDQS